MKKVLFQGTFDIMNWGHIQAFKDAKAQGDYLTVALNSDELVRTYKKREPILPFWQRKAILEAIVYIDEVIEADNFSPLELIKSLDIDVYVIGSEWKASKMKERAYIESKGGSVFYTPEYDGVIHSSDIRRKCVQEYLKNGAGK